MKTPIKMRYATELPFFIRIDIVGLAGSLIGHSEGAYEI
jgi:hypothetical protein